MYKIKDKDKRHYETLLQLPCVVELLEVEQLDNLVERPKFANVPPIGDIAILNKFADENIQQPRFSKIHCEYGGRYHSHRESLLLFFRKV